MGENKFNWKRLLITILFVLLTTSLVGGGVWYVMSEQAKSDKDAHDKQIQELQKQIDELRSNDESTDIKSEETSTESITKNEALPTEMGACATTSIVSIQNRIEGEPDMGKSVNYANNGYQVADGTSGLDNVPDHTQNMQDWKVGDQVRMCLLSIPTNCPAGDNRGKVYETTNLRTDETWQAPDAWHSCGGA
jgi:hypothetical protein